MEYIVPAAPLFALVNMAGKDDIRTYLNAVHVSVKRDHVTMTASNGHMLGRWRALTANVNEADFLVPVSVAKTLKPKTAGDSHVVFKDVQASAVSGAGPTVSVVQGSRPIFTCPFLCPTTYPKFANVIPPRSELGMPEVADFNPSYLVAMQTTVKVALGMGRGAAPHATVYHRGNQSAIVRVVLNVNDIAPEFFGIIMPIRQSKAEFDYLPEWAND